MRIQLKVSLLTLVFISVNSFAVSPTYTGLFSDVAIKGYDTVAYFTENMAVAGDQKYSTEYNDAQWHFSSQKNLNLFEGNPTKYAPQYGGYCAYAVSQNNTASIQPNLFTIYNDKLYLNYNQSVNEIWSTDKESYIRLADKNWPSLLAN